MPALGCCVDAAVSPPPYAFAGWDSTLPAPPPTNAAAWSPPTRRCYTRWTDGASRTSRLILTVTSLFVPMALTPWPTRKSICSSPVSISRFNPKGYEAHYQGVYPVKCNQDKFVVEDIVNFGSGFRFGLEAGVKAGASLSNEQPLKLHLNTVIVLEQEEELDIVINVSKLGVRPVIGLRAKLRTKHSGHFGSTSGEKDPIHFILADGVGEAAQVYCELVRLGACMRVIDIGGGLGIDYDGSKSQDSDISVGYSLQEYASAVVEAVRTVCDRKGVKHPVMCSESGRAIVSHHSILVFEAVSASSHDSNQISSHELQCFVERLTGEALADYRNFSAAAIRGETDGLCELVSKAIGVSDQFTLAIDGKIDKFIGGESSLPLHKLEGPYYMGMFLGGAYERRSEVSTTSSAARAWARVSERRAPQLRRDTRHAQASSWDVLHIMALTNGIACSFNNMPYLAAADSCRLTAAVNGGNNVYYYCDDEIFWSSGDSVVGVEEEQWSYCLA
ncbi:hypothetical protein DH2020_029591 [Rehmannia glutinosa]|uniref:Arginine decarboxylase n=1 Tax=Rehmannia glutinosa TaxID=99300 RepID=A0ABR0VRT5_REHGL